MADTPQLFGKPGKRHSFGWRWKSGPWDVYYEPGDGQHYIEIQHVDCLVFDRWYRQRATALRGAERKLASLAGSLVAMGVRGLVVLEAPTADEIVDGGDR